MDKFQYMIETVFFVGIHLMIGWLEKVSIKL